MNIVFSTLNINTYNCIIEEFLKIYSMNLCDVFTMKNYYYQFQ
jgi:hypothetical protein